MLEQDTNKKRMMLFMRFVRMVAAALCALGLLYLLHQHRLKKAQTTEPPAAQTAPETDSQPVENTPQQ